ncbi:hypothetical protein PsYK624_006180 [Phanerochaete sordida]|uniref:Uncharacterized protein n=1 Tax=Phanerochaete sordida TaxID=48140 RepID=A0A9P3FXY4_9APHY|nr:hypothetical protein PsYK624_006180 [Phanerochaete sordida]
MYATKSSYVSSASPGPSSMVPWHIPRQRLHVLSFSMGFDGELNLRGYSAFSSRTAMQFSETSPSAFCSYGRFSGRTVETTLPTASPARADRTAAYTSPGAMQTRTGSVASCCIATGGWGHLGCRTQNTSLT